MTAWTDALMGRAWLDSPARAIDVGYGGPADGDFASYVDQLLAQAEAQQRTAARGSGTPTRAAQDAAARQVPALATATGTVRARPAAALARAAGTGLKALVWRKLVPMALLLVAGMAVFFWQGAVFALLGLLVLLGLLTKVLRGKKR